MAATAWLMIRVITDIISPRGDPVRRLDIDDPQGGPFDHAPDRFRLGRRTRRPATGPPAAPTVPETVPESRHP
ncbi:hypothetical protein [Arthrobacter sp. ATA002]|uniref:hypothetical protein n=1 Tax=Arthrobacter sp. ATA002 TaxID=2991715 RepID=UPI002E31A093|nr:hypothetical protein [Arthrobacter sp. ATA002]